MQKTKIRTEGLKETTGKSFVDILTIVVADLIVIAILSLLLTITFNNPVFLGSILSISLSFSQAWKAFFIFGYSVYIFTKGK